jgi:hypothetical protein
MKLTNEKNLIKIKNMINNLPKNAIDSFFEWFVDNEKSPLVRMTNEENKTKYYDDNGKVMQNSNIYNEIKNKISKIDSRKAYNIKLEEQKKMIKNGNNSRSTSMNSSTSANSPVDENKIFIILDS